MARGLQRRLWHVSSCSPESNPQAHNPGCGIQSRELGSESGTPRSSPGTAPLAVRLNQSPPLPPTATLLSAVPGPSLLGRRPGLLQASLPFHASLCPNIHPQLLGHPRRQSWVCPTPHSSEGPSKAGALPSSCDILVPLLSTLGRVAPAVGLKFLGLTSGAA